MMIMTQGGSKLEVTKNHGVKFEAGTYVGRSVVYYVKAKIRKHREGVIKHIDITLGEYPTLQMAEDQKGLLERSLESGKTFLYMGAFPAPKDDLMQSLKAVDDFYKTESPAGYYLEVGMVNGKSNSRYGFNPDKDGSYAKALAKYQTDKPRVA